MLVRRIERINLKLVALVCCISIMIISGGAGSCKKDRDTDSGSSSPPAPVRSVIPLNAATDVALDATLNWVMPLLATSYAVHFSTSNPPDYQADTTELSYSPGALTRDTIYYWRIDAKNANGTTAGTVYSFQTIPTPPVAVSSGGLVDGAVDIPITTILTWGVASGATSYDVYLGSSDPPSYQGNVEALSFNPSIFSYETIYYWRIDPRNSGGATTGTTWSFTTESTPTVLPAQVTTPSPINGIVGASVSTTLSWSASSGASSYEVCFGTTEPPTVVATVTDTTYDPGTLSAGTTYYWRINAKNIIGTTTGTVWNFATTTGVGEPGGSEIENECLALVNQCRADNGGLPALIWDDDVAAVARAHSLDMRDRNFFDHINPDGQDPFDRLTAAGITYIAAAENVALGYTTAAAVMDAWMLSPGHRANILNDTVTHIGIGHITGGASGHYWTQVFIKP